MGWYERLGFAAFEGWVASMVKNPDSKRAAALRERLVELRNSLNRLFLALGWETVRDQYDQITKK